MKVEFVEFGRGKAPHAYFDLSLTVSNKLKLNLMNYFQRGRKLKWLSFFIIYNEFQPNS